MIGFVYLTFLVGAGMILFGNVERVNDSRINLIIVGPLLVALGYITGRGRSANEPQPVTVTNPPSDPVPTTDPEKGG